MTMGPMTVSMRVRMKRFRWGGGKGGVDRWTGRRACAMVVEMVIVCLDSTQRMFRRRVVMVTMRMVMMRMVVLRMVVLRMFMM